ncbi:hypothetical protein ABBQ38_004386 [Trebouxia sp. C0009 RCD-2024]
MVASPGVVSNQPARKQPKQNVLTKWLATSQHKAAAAQSVRPSLQPDSPMSAGSAAACRQEGEEPHAAVDSRPAQADTNGPFPMAPLADITNVLPESMASESSSVTRKPMCLEESLHKSVCEDGSATATQSEQHRVPQQQLQAEAASGCVAQRSCQPHPRPVLQTSNHLADSQQPSEGTGVWLANQQSKPAEVQQQVMKGLTSAVVRVDRDKKVKAACGIRVMWVSSQARRKGIATLLLDTARFALTFT